MNAVRLGLVLSPIIFALVGWPPEPCYAQEQIVPEIVVDSGILEKLGGESLLEKLGIDLSAERIAQVLEAINQAEMERSIANVVKQQNEYGIVYSHFSTADWAKAAANVTKSDELKETIPLIDITNGTAKFKNPIYICRNRVCTWKIDSIEIPFSTLAFTGAGVGTGCLFGTCKETVRKTIDNWIKDFDKSDVINQHIRVKSESHPQ